MSRPKVIKYTCSAVVLVAIVTQVVMRLNRWQTAPDSRWPEETWSAIKRAKTLACKQELAQFANSHLEDNVFPAALERSCPLDKKVTRYERINCIPSSLGPTDAVRIEEPTVEQSTCLDTCSSYGHTLAGFHSSTSQCLCSNAEEQLESGWQSSQMTTAQDAECTNWFRVGVGLHRPRTGASHRKQNSASPDSLRIAFLLTVNGKSSMQIRRLLRNIFSPRHLYYIHVDRREQHLFQDLSSLETKYDNILLAQERHDSIWGGTSLLRAMIETMRRLQPLEWNYLINLSESDFPVKNIKLLEEFLAINYGAIFLRSHNMDGYNFIKKQGLLWNFYQCESRLWRLGKRRLPRGIVYSGGSDWFALPKDFCDHIAEHSSNETGLVKPLLQLFNFTLLPAESFFHTLAQNGAFCDRLINDNLRLTNWQRKQGCKCQHKDVVDWCGCSPLVFRWPDRSRLLATNQRDSLFFARKFDPTVSSSIVGEVERRLVKTCPPYEPNTVHDTRYWLKVGPTSEDRSLSNFARLALQQVAREPNFQGKNLKLLENSAFLYFNEDRFVGLTLAFCDPAEPAARCVELLVRRKPDAHLTDLQQCPCFEGSTLKLVEVNHSFDPSERIFRNYLPLSDRNDLVVYHEWLVQGSKARQVQFNWIDPSQTTALVQNVELKATSKPTSLSLAHRLNVSHHAMSSGLWTLLFKCNRETCLGYKFLIFNSDVELVGNVSQSPSQSQFDDFYSVTMGHHCDADASKTCENQSSWTTNAMKTFSRLHGLS